MTKNDADVLREIREALGMTVAELAAEIEMSPELLELWETGRTKPRAGLWRALVELIAERGRIILEPSAEAAERRLQRRERARADEVADLAAKLTAPRRR